METAHTKLLILSCHSNAEISDSYCTYLRQDLCIEKYYSILRKDLLAVSPNMIRFEKIASVQFYSGLSFKINSCFGVKEATFAMATTRTHLELMAYVKPLSLAT